MSSCCSDAVSKRPIIYPGIQFTTMAKFKTTIQLEDADDKDYTVFQHELERQSLKSKQQVAKSKTNIGGKKEYQWKGDITIREIANAIFRAASKTGKKFSFTIMKSKTVAG